MFVGTDIVEVDRIKKAIERTGEPFLARVYTPAERQYCDNTKGSRRRYDSYAARFAAKEAYSKAAGTGIGADASLNEIEVTNLENGMPVLTLYGTAKAYFEAHFAGCRIDVSLSHTAKLAVATVLISKEKQG